MANHLSLVLINRICNDLYPGLSIFGDIHHIPAFLLEDIAFLPIEVLLVTLIIHRLLRNMEKRNRLEKLNMVIGAFYVQVGTSLWLSL